MNDSLAAANQPAATPGRRPWWRSGLAAATDLLFPPRCAGCGIECQAQHDQPLFCPSCAAELGPAERPACRRCAMPCSAADRDAGDCYDCRGRKLLFQAARALGPYHGPLRDAVLRIKHYYHEPLAVALGHRLAEHIREQAYDGEIDLVAPVPMHWLKRLWRGTNAPDTLARSAAEVLDLPAIADLLVCRRVLRRQATLPADQRRRNVRHAYRVGWPYNLRGARVLLIDDVITSGATAHEAARAVRQSGATAVYVAAVARGTGNF